MIDRDAFREMAPLRVYRNDFDEIVIMQDASDSWRAESPSLFVHPAQVDVLIQWLRELRDEIHADAAEMRDTVRPA